MAGSGAAALMAAAVAADRELADRELADRELAVLVLERTGLLGGTSSSPGPW